MTNDLPREHPGAAGPPPTAGRPAAGAAHSPGAAPAAGSPLGDGARKSPISRRRLIGGLGVAAALMPLAPALLTRGAEAGEDTSNAGARQWAMVIDLRKCEGCVTRDEPPACTEACNLVHSVPPGSEWIRIFEVETPGGSYFLPRPCMHCENAPCVNVCPVGASFHNAEGLVLINHDRCIGCRLCMAACPYGARSFNWAQPPNPPEASLGSYRPEYPVPHRNGTAEKCMLCAHEVEVGKLPACAEGCPMFAIYIADLNTDLATNGKEVVQLSRFLAENSGYRLYEELGTKPRVWYIPGHGQESDRHPDDQREMTPARTWIELRALKEKKAAWLEQGHEGGAS